MFPYALLLAATAHAYPYSFVEEELLQALSENLARIKVVNEAGKAADAGPLLRVALAPAPTPAQEFGRHARIGTGPAGSAAKVTCAPARKGASRATDFDCTLRLPTAPQAFLVRALRPSEGDQKLRLRSFRVTVLNSPERIL